MAAGRADFPGLQLPWLDGDDSGWGQGLGYSADVDIQFLLHAPNAFEVDEPSRTVTIINGPAAARIHLLGTGPVTFVQTDHFSAPPESLEVDTESPRCEGRG